MADPATSQQDVGAPTLNERSSLGARVRFALRVLQARLRFIMVLVLVFAVLAAWNSLTRWSEWVITRMTGTGARPESVSPDTEYFCPMCPGVASNWPEKCPVCKMPLVRRRKGDASLLPEGVLARMQLSPQRLQLAGVSTSEVRYENLQREWQTTATVEVDPQRLAMVTAPASGVIVRLPHELIWRQVFKDQVLATIRPTEASRASGTTDVHSPQDGRLIRIVGIYGELVESGQALAEVADLSCVQIRTHIAHDDLPFVAPNQQVEIIPNSSTSNMAILGKVIAIQSVLDHAAAGAQVLIQADDPSQTLKPGTSARVRWQIPLAHIEPFRSLPRNPPPSTKDDVREVYHCANHPSYLHTRPGTCPYDDQRLEMRVLAPNQRVQWHCPAHEECVDSSASDCPSCLGLPLIPRIVSYSPADQVLAIPDSAIIDTGETQIVFVETAPGMFDAVSIEVGPRAGASRAVIGGVELGQRVVSSGAFLLDAETRLTANLSAAYFGAGQRRGGSERAVIESKDGEPLPVESEHQLSPGDAARVKLQKICPTTGFSLGSMGTPVRVRVGEHVVYLCCAGCKTRIKGAVDLPDVIPENQMQPVHRSSESGPSGS